MTDDAASSGCDDGKVASPLDTVRALLAKGDQGKVLAMFASLVANNSAMQRQLARTYSASPPNSNYGFASPIRIVYFGFFGVFAAMESTFALYCEAAFGWGSRQTGYLFALIGVVILVTQGVLVGRFVRWMGEKRTMLVGLAILAAGLGGAAFAPSVTVLAVGSAGIAMGNGLVSPAMSSLVSQHTSAAEQGWAQGRSQSAARLARIMAPVAAGIAFELIGPGVPMAVGAIVLVVVLLPMAASKVSGAPASPDNAAPDVGS